MKKPFHETRLFKTLNKPAVKGTLGMVPFGIGSAITNILNVGPNSKPGEPEPTTFPQDMIKLVIYAILIYLALSGKITMDQAQDAKEFITQ